MWSFVDDGPSAVQFVIAVSGTLMAASHILRPEIWVDLFARLHEQGTRGVLTRTFMFELWPALLVVTLHQVWTGIAVVVTVYGWLQLAKITVSVLAPETAARSMGKRDAGAFRLGGVILLVISASAAGALLG